MDHFLFPAARLSPESSSRPPCGGAPRVRPLLRRLPLLCDHFHSTRPAVTACARGSPYASLHLSILLLLLLPPLPLPLPLQPNPGRKPATAAPTSGNYKIHSFTALSAPGNGAAAAPLLNNCPAAAFAQPLSNLVLATPLPWDFCSYPSMFQERATPKTSRRVTLGPWLVAAAWDGNGDQAWGGHTRNHLAECPE